MSTYFAENVKIKRILEDLIGNAFPNSAKLDEYKRFYIKITDKNVKSYAGRYNIASKTIEIVGLDRQSKHILITCLHELAHHIDNCNRGKTDHSADFYMVYTKLIHTGLNMRLFTPEDMSMEDVSDAEKIRKIVDDWRPRMIDYKSDYILIRVYNCYSQKDALKANYYKYNAMAKAWEKEISSSSKERELEFLHENGLSDEDINISDANDINIEKKIRIEATGNTYDYKDILKEYGFYYKDKKWFRNCTKDENINSLINRFSKEMPEAKFKFTV